MLWQNSYMNTNYSLPHMTVCSLCSEDIPAGTSFYLDDYLDAEDGTVCQACVNEMETYYSENPQGDENAVCECEYCEDGDASRKFALENRD